MNATNEIMELVDKYWDLAYKEAFERRTHDTENGDAQDTRMNIVITVSTMEESNRALIAEREIMVRTHRETVEALQKKVWELEHTVNRLNRVVE